MSRYQLVLRDPEGDSDHVFVVDNPDSPVDNEASEHFSYRGQCLREGAPVEVAAGAVYIVVEQIEEDSLTRFICEPL